MYLVFINFSSFKPDTENNTNFVSYASHCLSTWRRSVKKTKFWSNVCMNVKVTSYNALQFITEFPDKGWTKNSISRLLVKLRKFRTVRRVIFVTSGDAINSNSLMSGLCLNVCRLCVSNIMSLGICLKKLHIVKLGAFLLDTASKFALFLVPGWRVFLRHSVVVHEHARLWSV